MLPLLAIFMVVFILLGCGMIVALALREHWQHEQFKKPRRKREKEKH